MGEIDFIRRNSLPYLVREKPECKTVCDEFANVMTIVNLFLLLFFWFLLIPLTQIDRAKRNDNTY